MTLFGLALRNLRRNRFRAILTALGVAVAILTFVLLRTVIWAWNVAAEYAAKDRIATRHKVSFVIQLPKRYIDDVRAIKGVKAATWANWFGAKDPKDPNNFFANMAVDPASFLEVYDEIVLPPQQKRAWLENRRGAIVGDVLARKMGVKIGDRVTLLGTIYAGDWPFEIVGIYSAARKSIDRSQFLFHWEYMNESMPERRRDLIGWIVARIDDPGRGADISAKIDSVFDVRDAQTITMSERSLQLSFMAMFSAMLRALDIVSIIILVIMMMILGNTIAMGVRERTGEYGVLRAVGFLPRHIATFIVGESIALGLVGGVLGIAISYPIVELGIGRFLEENMGSFFPYFRVDPKVAGAALLLSGLLGAAAAILPARGAARLSVIDSLRRVE
ncbi:MAG: FtsX-like permease family protein [Myxococcota bacterium]